MFLKHGEIEDKFTISLDFLRDMNNTLGLLSEEQHGNRLENIYTDTLDQICKFHNIQRKEIENNFAEDKRYKVQDLDYNIEVMVVAELWLNHQKYEPDIQTGVLTSYELAQTIDFPICIKDLTQNTHVGITIYDMAKPFKDSLLASTVLDIFDSK